MKNFNDKVAVITGAGGGVGSALARELAERGCNLALVDVNEDALKALAHVGLPLVGTHHRGIDDARNIARLLPHSLAPESVDA